jgi:hypothetical protein
VVRYPRIMHGSSHTFSRRSGQALVELAVGLLVIVLLTTGIIGFVQLSGAKGETLAEARAEAGRKAASGGLAVSQSPDFFRDWEEGADGLRHTADDTKQRDSASRLQNLAGQSVPDESQWALLESRRHSSMARLGRGTFPMGALSMVHAEEARTVELSPAMRDWIVGKDSITVASDVWLPRLELGGFDD